MKKDFFVIAATVIILSTCGVPATLAPEPTMTMPPTSTNFPLSTATTTHQVKTQVEYRNSDLGFSFSLPSSWEGFTIQNIEWEGLKSGDLGDEVVQRGPLISIVHPKSSVQQPRQDTPIMIFTIEQWDQLQQGEWHIGAAPIGPSELGRNSKHVFALPARYNYALLEGWEEVEQNLKSHPLVTFEPSVSP
jgi:hypothetical protein